MWYLKKRYTYSDLQDGDRYILGVVKNMCYDLGKIENELAGYTSMQLIREDCPSSKFYILINNIELYCSNEYELFESEMKETIEKNINKELSVLLWKLWKKTRKKYCYLLNVL